MSRLATHRKVNIFHLSFEIALLLKALDALFETIGGILLIFLNPSMVTKFVEKLTSAELAEDPKDAIANVLIHLSESFSISSQHFGVYFLISHGVLKLVLVYLLWRKKIWAYPAAVILLLLFILYQIYKFILTGSVVMILLTILDVIIIILIIIEYRNQKVLEIPLDC